MSRKTVFLRHYRNRYRAVHIIKYFFLHRWNQTTNVIINHHALDNSSSFDSNYLLDIYWFSPYPTWYNTGPQLMNSSWFVVIIADSSTKSIRHCHYGKCVNATSTCYISSLSDLLSPQPRLITFSELCAELSNKYMEIQKFDLRY